MYRRFPKSYLISTAVTILALFSGGCTSVGTWVSMNRFNSPEATGETFRLTGEVGFDRTSQIVFTTDASARPPTINNPAQASSGPSYTFFKFETGILSFIDISARTGLGNLTPSFLTAKIQLLGSPQNQAKASNFSLAVTASGGGAYNYQSGDQDGTFGRAGNNWNSDVTTTAQQFAAIIGYRVSDLVLFYGGVFKDFYYASGSIHQALSTSSTSATSGPGGVYTFAGDGTNSGFNIDAQFNLVASKKTYITVEYVRSTVDWKLNNSVVNSGIGAVFGIHF